MMMMKRSAEQCGARLPALVPAALLVLALAPPAAASSCPPPEPVVNDRCASAMPLGSNPHQLRLTGSTELATDDYDIGHDNPCTGAQSRGPDMVYSFTLDSGCLATLWLHLCDPVRWYDQSLYVTTQCGTMLGDCSGRDWPCIDGECPWEHAGWHNQSGTPQTLYVVLDGKYPSSAGAWVLDIDTECVVPVEETSWGSIKASYQE